MANWKLWGDAPGRCILRWLGRAAHLWLWWFSSQWWWLSHPTHLCLQRLSNCPHLLRFNSHPWLLLWLNSRPCPLPCRLWLLLRPLSLPWYSCSILTIPCLNSCCTFLATLSCPCGCPCSCLIILPIGASHPLGHAHPPQVPKPWEPRVVWGSSEGCMAGALRWPRGPWPSLALCPPPLPFSNQSLL